MSSTYTPDLSRPFPLHKNRFQGTNSASLAGPYDNPIPTLFLAPIDCLKIPAQFRPVVQCIGGGGGGGT